MMLMLAVVMVSVGFSGVYAQGVVHAQLPDIPPGLAAQADAALDAVVGQMVGVQGDYVECNKRYWQGLRVASETPGNGVGGNADRLDEAVEYQDEYVGKVAGECEVERTVVGVSWNELEVVIPASPIINVFVDQYVGAGCNGYVVTGEIEVGGKLYRKGIDVGCEGYREHDWIEVLQQ